MLDALRELRAMIEICDAFSRAQTPHTQTAYTQITRDASLIGEEERAPD